MLDLCLITERNVGMIYEVAFQTNRGFHTIYARVISRFVLNPLQVCSSITPTPSATYMRQWTVSSLAQVMACRLFGTKPSPEPALPYCWFDSRENKANLRDLIPANGLEWNRLFFSPCHLEICWMTLKSNRTHLLYYVKLCASFQIHRWIQTGITVRKRSIRVKIGNFSCPVWPWNLMDDLEKTIAHIFYAMSSFAHEFKVELQSGNTQFGSKSIFFCPVWPSNWTDDLEKQ